VVMLNPIFVCEEAMERMAYSSNIRDFGQWRAALPSANQEGRAVPLIG